MPITAPAANYVHIIVHAIKETIMYNRNRSGNGHPVNGTHVCMHLMYVCQEKPLGHAVNRMDAKDDIEHKYDETPNVSAKCT